MTWRPQFPDELEKRAEQIAESEGYQTKSEFVRDAVRRRIEELKEDDDSVQKEIPPDINNLKESALDEDKMADEREDTIEVLGNFGEAAVPALSEIVNDAEGSYSGRDSDESRADHGQKLRQMAREEIRKITEE